LTFVDNHQLPSSNSSCRRRSCPLDGWCHGHVQGVWSYWSIDDSRPL